MAERFPIHVVTAWLGNTPEIARKHYLQTTDEHFQRALESAAPSPPAGPSVQCACSALQNPVQSVAVRVRQDRYETREKSGKRELSRSLVYAKADGEGFEPPVGFRPLQFSRLPQ